jgi:hypothetical protein
MENDFETPTIKRPTFDLSRFRVGGEKVTPEYENYIHLTAKLIKRSYIATAKLVETWPLEKIIRHYELCTKHAGTMPGDIKWWWLRKKEK